jgi:hypothetical protein
MSLYINNCLVASPNIQSNSIVKLPGVKLKMSLKTHLPYIWLLEMGSLVTIATYNGLWCGNVDWIVLA